MTTKIQYIKSKLQVETAKNLLNEALQTKKNEKAKLLFKKDLAKIEKVIKKRRPGLMKAAKELSKQEEAFNLEIKKITNKKCTLDDIIVDKRAIEKLGEVSIRNAKYSTCAIYDEDLDIRVYEESIDTKKDQEEINNFVLEMILGKITADELQRLIIKIKNN